MADSGHQIRSFNVKLARQEHLPQLSQNAPRLTEEEWGVLEEYMASGHLPDKLKSVIAYAKSKAEEQLFLEDLVEDTPEMLSENKASASGSAVNTTTTTSIKSRAMTDATVLLALHREARVGSLASVSTGKTRPFEPVPVIVVCVRWSSTPPQFTQKKAELKRFMEKELVPWIWADLQASGRSNCELAQAVAAARFRPAVGSAVAGGAGGEDAGVEEEHRVWHKVVKEDLSMATAVGVIGLNSLVSDMASAAYVVGATSANTPFYFVNNMKETQKYSREALLEQFRQPMAWTVTGGRHQLNRLSTAMMNGYVHRRLTQLGCCATGEFHRYDHISAPLQLASVPWQAATGHDIKCPLCDDRIVRIGTWQAWVIHVWTEHRHQLPIECRKELGLGASYANTQLATVCPELAVASSRSHLERYFFVASEAGLSKTLGVTLGKASASGSGTGGSKAGGEEAGEGGSGATDKGKARDFGCPINLPSCRPEHSKPRHEWTARELAIHVKNKHGATRTCPFGVGAWCTQSPQKLNVDQLEQHILEHRKAVQASDAKTQEELREHKEGFDAAKKRKTSK